MVDGHWREGSRVLSYRDVLVSTSPVTGGKMRRVGRSFNEFFHVTREFLLGFYYDTIASHPPLRSLLLIMMYTRTFRLLPCRQKLVTLQLTRSVSCFSTRKCPGGIYSRSPPTDRYISVSAAFREGEKASSSSPTQDEVGSHWRCPPTY